MNRKTLVLVGIFFLTLLLNIENVTGKQTNPVLRIGETTVFQDDWLTVGLEFFTTI